jgi:hypothetical protein
MPYVSTSALTDHGITFAFRLMTAMIFATREAKSRGTLDLPPPPLPLSSSRSRSSSGSSRRCLIQ